MKPPKQNIIIGQAGKGKRVLRARASFGAKQNINCRTHGINLQVSSTQAAY